MISWSDFTDKQSTHAKTQSIGETKLNLNEPIES